MIKCKFTDLISQKAQSSWMSNIKKSMTQLNAAYKKPAPAVRVHIDAKWGGGKIFCVRGNQKEVGKDILDKKLYTKNISKRQGRSYIMITG